MSIEFWAYPTSILNSSQAAVSRYYTSGDSSTSYIVEAQGAGTWRFLIQQSDLSLKGVSGGTVRLNEWNHIAAVADGSFLRLYVNGVSVGTPTSYDGTILQGDRSTLIGRTRTEDSYGYFSGRIDEVKIYNYDKTPKQIFQTLNAGHPAGGSPVGSQTLYLKFDEGNGTIANDASGYKAQGTLTCQSGGCINPQWRDGKFGKALLFDGSDQANNSTVTLSNTTYPQLNITGDVTISTWIKPSSDFVDTAQAVLRNGQGTDLVYGLFYDPTNQRPYFHWYDGAFKQANGISNSAPLDEWSYVSVVRSGTTISLYVNGKLTNSVAGTATTASASVLAIGRTFNAAVNQDYSGLIDELKIYNYALNENDVKIDYNQGRSIVLGALGTASDGTPTNSADAQYCIPGDTASCTGPTGEWNFETGTGSIAYDTSGNGRNGTINSASWTQGKIGKALNFTGSDSVTTGMSSNNFISASAGTIEVWMKPTGSPVTAANVYNLPGIVMDDCCAGGYYGILRGNLTGVGDGIYAFNYDGSSDYVRLSDYNTNEWVHIAWVHYEGTLYLYKNGQLVGSTASGNTSSGFSSYNLRMGDNASNSGFTGSIDQVRTFNYARTPAQIAYDYNKGGPVGHWKFDECQGTTAHDSSGNNLHGTINIGGSGSQTSAGTCQTASTAWGNGVQGKYNASLNFDGTDDYVGLNTSIGNGYPQISISAWIYPTSTNIGTVIGKNGPFYLAYGNSFTGATQKVGAARYNGSSWANVTGNTTIPLNTWSHISMVYDGTTIKVFLNGKQDGSTAATGSLSSTGAQAQIGGNTPEGMDQFFTGRIDDLRLYNYPLTLTQVKNVQNQGAAVQF